MELPTTERAGLAGRDVEAQFLGRRIEVTNTEEAGRGFRGRGGSGEGGDGEGMGLFEEFFEGERGVAAGVVSGVTGRERRRAAIAAGYAPVSSAVAVSPVAAETDRAFKIHCIPVAGVVDLPERIRAECRRQEGGGLTLPSSFVHDRHVFLVFKREPSPVAGGAPRFSIRST